MNTLLKDIQLKMARDERNSAINYDLMRVASKVSYARRKPGTVAMLILALFGWFKGD